MVLPVSAEKLWKLLYHEIHRSYEWNSTVTFQEVRAS